MNTISKKVFIHKIHLFISVLIVIPIAIVYGFEPQSQFDIFPETNDEHNFFKAIMGLYLSFSFLWVLGILKDNYLKTALISNMIFMLGLAFGRILSFITNGNPSLGFQLGTFGELLIGFYGIWILTNKNSSFAKK